MKYLAVLSLFAAAVAASNHEEPCTHNVVVGGVKPNGGGDPTPMLIYQPESIKAKIGDKVVFKFMQANHTVTQSTFDTPCVKMADGADSGFMPNMEGRDDVTWEYLVETEEPIWMYCKQKTGMHCGKGMVFSINAAEYGDKTFAAYKQLAIIQNGTELEPAEIQKGQPKDAGEGINVRLGEGGVDKKYGEEKYGQEPYPTDAAPQGSPSVAVGHGVNGKGDSCQCSCLCGSNPFPNGLGAHNYGGYGGMLPKQ